MITDGNLLEGVKKTMGKKHCGPVWADSEMLHFWEETLWEETRVISPMRPRRVWRSTQTKTRGKHHQSPGDKKSFFRGVRQKMGNGLKHVQSGRHLE